jgi:hypothetical protein
MKKSMIFFVSIIVTVLVLSFIGCAGQCIKVGGSYQGIQGEVEYCFSQEKSEKNGLPTMEAEGLDKILLDESILDKLLSKLEGVTGKEKKSFKSRIDEAIKE